MLYSCQELQITLNYIRIEEHILKSNNTTKDFTSGNIYMQMLELSIPLILGNILQQFYNTIDAFVVGRYAGADEFAAIGIAGTIMNLFFHDSRCMYRNVRFIFKILWPEEL